MQACDGMFAHALHVYALVCVFVFVRFNSSACTCMHAFICMHTFMCRYVCKYDILHYIIACIYCMCMHRLMFVNGGCFSTYECVSECLHVCMYV